MTLLIIAVFLALLFLGVPLYIAVLGLGIYLFTTADLPLISAIVSFQKLESQSFLSAIPLFTFAGYLLSQSKASQRFIVLSQAMFSFIPGSTSLVVVLVMALFTSLTGASGVSILALGGLMYPLLKNASGDDRFSYGIITASGSIGLLFAPALPVIIYAIVNNQNSQTQNLDIETLFYIALVPSFLLIGLFTLFSIFKERSLARKNLGSLKNYGKTPRQPLLPALWQARYEIPLPFLVYGGIYLGFISVLEASILTALYTFALVFFIRRDLSIRRDFVNTTVQSLKLSGGIFIIMVSAFVLTNYLVYERIPDQLFSFLSTFIESKLSFLLLVNVFLLLTGCLLDIFSAILIVLPLLVPLVEKYGIDPYHFAIIFLVNLEIGYLTPPVGLNLFIASYRFNKSIVYLYRSIVPFLAIMAITLALITYVPKISTFFLGQEHALASDTVAPATVQANLIDSGETTIAIGLEACSDNSGQACPLYSVIYLDEKTEDIEFLNDLGFREDLYIDTNTDSDASLSNATLTFSNDRLTIVLEQLTPQTDYTIVVTATDKAGNQSIPSNPIFVTTK